MLQVFFVLNSLAAELYADDFSRIKREREKAMREFEDAENAYEEERAETINQDEAIRQKLYQEKPKNLTEIIQPSPNSKPSEAPIAQDTTPSNPVTGYLRKLKNAYPCMRAFIQDLYAARYQNDSQQVACATRSKDCDGKALSLNQREKEAVTVTQKFYQCLDH